MVKRPPELQVAGPTYDILESLPTIAPVLSDAMFDAGMLTPKYTLLTVLPELQRTPCGPLLPAVVLGVK